MPYSFRYLKYRFDWEFFLEFILRNIRQISYFLARFLIEIVIIKSKIKENYVDTRYRRLID